VVPYYHINGTLTARGERKTFVANGRMILGEHDGVFYDQRYGREPINNVRLDL